MVMEAVQEAALLETLGSHTFENSPCQKLRNFSLPGFVAMIITKHKVCNVERKG